MRILSSITSHNRLVPDILHLGPQHFLNDFLFCELKPLDSHSVPRLMCLDWQCGGLPPPMPPLFVLVCSLLVKTFWQDNQSATGTLTHDFNWLQEGSILMERFLPWISWLKCLIANFICPNSLLHVVYYTAEIPGSNFFDSDSGSDTTLSWNPVPMQVLWLAMSRTRLVWFRDWTFL